MKTIVVAFAAAFLALGAIVSFSATAEAGDCGFFNTCYTFDSVKEVDITNFTDLSGLSIVGPVGGVQKNLTISVPKGGGNYILQVQSNCARVALLAQTNPEKYQLVTAASTNESANGAFVNLTTDSVSCNLASK
jgi:hypothetical protein